MYPYGEAGTMPLHCINTEQWNTISHGATDKFIPKAKWQMLFTPTPGKAACNYATPGI